MAAEKTEETKRRIDKMSYAELLSLWRFAPAGHPYFQGEVGDYYAKVMKEKGGSISNAERVATSKALG